MDKKLQELKDFLETDGHFPAYGQTIIDLWREAHRDEVEISNELIRNLDPAQEYENADQIINAIRREKEPLV